MPSIDVVIPNYQYGRYLPGCVASILAQGIPDTRILIIDNASTDNSVEVAQEIARQDARVELVARSTNLGPHASFNEGLDWARARYFSVMCADDLAMPQAYARAIALMERHPGVGLAYGRALRVIGDEPPAASAQGSPGSRWRIQPGRAAIEAFCRQGFLPMVCCSTIMRTEAHKRAGYYRPSLPHSDDFELWLRVACLADVASTEAVQGALRIHPQALSRFTYDHCLWDFSMYEGLFEAFFAQEGGRLESGERLYRLARRGVSSRAYWSGLARACRGEWSDALTLLRYAVHHHPSMAVLPPLPYLFRREGTTHRIRWSIRRAAETVRRAVLSENHPVADQAVPAIRR
jgi:glycosyltransferase involved in cell wall biosynthesis